MNYWGLKLVLRAQPHLTSDELDKTVDFWTDRPGKQGRPDQTAPEKLYDNGLYCLQFHIHPVTVFLQSKKSLTILGQLQFQMSYKLSFTVIVIRISNSNPYNTIKLYFHIAYGIMAQVPVLTNMVP